MKEKINYTLQENFRWYFKRVKKYHQVLIPQMIAMVILESLQSILLVLLPTVLVSSLVSHVSLGIFAFRVFGLGLLLAVIIYLLGLVEATTTGYKIDIRSNIGVEINEANLKTEYQNLETSEFRLIHQMAEDNGVGNNAAGAEAFYTHISLLARKISSFILFSLTLTVIRPSLFLIVLGTTIINYYALKWVRNYREKIKKSRGEVQARLKYLEQNAYAVENGKDIRLYQMDSWYQEHITENIAESDKWQERLSTREFISSSIQDITMFGRNILAYLFLIIKIIKGTMSLTDFTLFFTILNQLTSYLNEITLTLNELTRASQDLNDIRYYLDVASASILQEIDISAEIQALQAQPNYRFRLENVSYTYPGSQEATIAGLDLMIEVGEKLALVGANGAGKSTLVKLISGLIRPTSGTIYLNDIDISEIPHDFYFELIAPVFQEASVLAFDLGHNVALAKEYDEVRVENCLIQAGLGEKLAKLPQGLKTAMTTYVDLQGVSFSGGEEQKLMLARALYKNSGMLILDEPTAALDALAESDLYEKYNELTVGKTSLFISHRLASTRFCDRIIFLSEGVIKESGSHEELLARKGEYAAMYEIQSRYYQKEVV